MRIKSSQVPDLSSILQGHERGHATEFFGARQLTKNFNSVEFASRDGDARTLVHLHLVVGLQALRDLLGRVIVLSGYRSPSHNERVGGVPHSYHIYGMAADIVVPGVSTAQLRDICESLGFGGVGCYKRRGFIHVDVGEPRFWGHLDREQTNAFLADDPPPTGGSDRIPGVPF